MTDPLQCPHCEKMSKTERGVTQHIHQTAACKQKQHEAISSATKLGKRKANDPEPRRSNRLQRLHEDVPVQQKVASGNRLAFASGNNPPDLPDHEPDDVAPPCSG